MTNQQILEKAIQKAVDAGWDNPEGAKPIEIYGLIYITHADIPPTVLFDVKELIFDHNFAKALWGGKGYAGNDAWDREHTELGRNKKPYWVITWQYHLQQMVIADDPIKYLGEKLPI